jgi:hypothetical protein
MLFRTIIMMNELTSFCSFGWRMKMLLQSISRYATWLNSVTGAYLNHSTTGAEHRKGNEPKSRMSTDMNRVSGDDLLRYGSGLSDDFDLG